MSSQFPALIIITPLMAAFLIAAAGWLNPGHCLPILAAALTVALMAAVGLLGAVVTGGTVLYRLGGWDPPWGIAYRVDHLNSLVLVVIIVVALINLATTRAHVRREFPNRVGPFYTLYALFVTGLLGIVVTGDAFNLYVLLEIAALTGYALIGMGHPRAPLASLNYIFMGTIGASFYLLGIGYLYLVTGSLNMADIAVRLPGLYGSRVVVTAFIICMTGLFIKMALFPLHGWLPNAYSHAPSAAVAVIAPLTTKVMIYVMIRIALYVFTPSFVFGHLKIDGLLVWLAVAAIVMGSLMALAQTGIKKMLVYIIVAEVGYMVGGFWLGNRPAITGAILHIINDALMTLCVFLAAGAIVYKTGTDAFTGLRGLFHKMPFTMAGLVVGALAIIGVPPTCGFFSKWYLIRGGLAAGQYPFVGALIFSSLVNVLLFFRLFEVAYYEPSTVHVTAGHHYSGRRDEAPLELLLPLLATAGLLIVLGLYTGDIVQHIIRLAIPAQVM